MGEARQFAAPALALAGGIIGSFWGPYAAMAGSAAGGLIGGLISARAVKPLLPEVQSMTSSYGTTIPRIFGSVVLPGKEIWAGPIYQRKSKKGGGKGSKSGAAPAYYMDAAVAFCRGPADCQKIWLDGKLFWDSTLNGGRSLSEHTFTFRIYNGTSDQIPDPLVSAWVADNVTPGDAPLAYRDLCYIVFEGPNLAYYGGRFPQVKALWVTSSTKELVHVAMQNPGLTDGAPYPNYANWEGWQGVAVDWTRDLIYTITGTGSYDSGLRVYNASTGVLINSVTSAELGITIGPGPNSAAGSIICTQGGGLYVYGSFFSYSPRTIFTIDPVTLSVLHTQPISIWTGSSAGQMGSSVGFLIPTPDGPVDMVATLTGYPLSLVIVNPATGDAAILEGAIDRSIWSVAANTSFVVGATDYENNSVTLWWIQVKFLGEPSGALHINKIVVRNTDPTIIIETGDVHYDFAIIYPTDFGYASAYAWPVEVQYSPTDDSLIIQASWPGAAAELLFKWSESSGIGWWRPRDTGNTSDRIDQNAYSRNDRGMTGHSYSNTDLATGDVTATPGSIANYQGFGALAFDSISNSFITLYGPLPMTIYRVYLGRSVNHLVTVAGIISELCADVGIDSSMLDVSGITDTIHGYAITDQKSVVAAIADLADTFSLNMFESEYKLFVTQRGLASVATIPQADLAPTGGSDAGSYWSITRAQELEMPLQINVRFIDPQLDYQIGSSMARRSTLPIPTQYSKRTKTVDLPIIVDSTGARQIAETWLYNTWAERNRYGAKLGQKYLYLDPADNIVVSLDNGRQYASRIEHTLTGADLAIELSGSSEDGTIYVPSAARGSQYGQPPAVVETPASASLLMFNSTLLHDSHDTGGLSTRLYIGVGAYGPGWPGGLIFKSADGSTWVMVTTASIGSSWGTALNILGGTPSVYSLDDVHALTVGMTPGGTAPESCTWTQLMNGENMVRVGDELLQFQTVTAIVGDTYTLTNLLRGRRGTEWAVDAHISAETVIFLDEAGISETTLGLAEINASEGWRLSSISGFDAVSTTNFTDRGWDLMPYMPINFTRAASGGDEVITFTRQGRLAHALLDGTDTIQLSETTEAYEVYVLANATSIDTFDPTDAGTYLRKYEPTTSTATYTAAEMSSDGFTPSTDTLYVAAYQVSSVIGRGFRGYAAIPAF